MITEKKQSGRTGKSVVEATAYHEAGHVAAQLYFRHPFKYVTIISNDESLGHVKHKLNRRVKEIIEYDTPTASDERYFKHEMISLMAGGASEAKYLGLKKFTEGCENDLSLLVDFCQGIGIYNIALTHYSNYIIETAKDLFEKEELWNYVKALDDLLNKKKTVKYLECKKAYVEICGHFHCY